MKNLILISVFTFALARSVVGAEADVVAPDVSTPNSPPMIRVSESLGELQRSLKELEATTDEDSSISLKQIYKGMISETQKLLTEVKSKQLTIEDTEKELEKINNKYNPFASGSFYS